MNYIFVFVDTVLMEDPCIIFVNFDHKKYNFNPKLTLVSVLRNFIGFCP